MSQDRSKDAGPAGTQTSGETASEESAARPLPSPDLEVLARNMGRAVEEAGRVMAAYFRPRENGPPRDSVADEVTDAVKTLGTVATYWMREPSRAIEAQASLARGFIDLWSQSLRRMAGETAAPAAEPGPRDRRFQDPDWQRLHYYDLLKQAYLITSRWAERLVTDADELDPHTRRKAEFYVRQLSAALSPSNFLGTNPELLRTTLEENGENLVRGLTMLTEDIQAGGGNLKIRQSDMTSFELGVNLATTPGKVVFRNALMEMIQYQPATERVVRRPLLIIPPWINKFYILDLTPEKSFIKWCVDQGLTVFVISWVNPDERHRDKGFSDYMREGPVAALEQIKAITGEPEVSAIGYCIGGTLLAMALAVMAARDDAGIASATFFTAQVDFERAGDLKVFIDEEQIAAVEREMETRGYLLGRRMANSFNLLRSQDLIWPYIVNNYVRGRQPVAFDLLAWNADATRLTAAGHASYLRDCYLGNKLTRGEMVVDGVLVDLKTVRLPIYSLATREDHIAPARSVFAGAKSFGGPVRYVVAGSGHIAGVVNPPTRQKYGYWTGGDVAGTFEDWLDAAEEHQGSWWPDWFAWVEAEAPERVSAADRQPGGGRETLGDAPGTYVLVRE